MSRKQPHSGVRRERWHGDPQEEIQPDAGDVLAYVDKESGVFTGPVMLVRHASPVRGKADQPHELWLWLKEGHVGHLRSTEGTVFSAWKRKNRRDDLR